MMETPQLQPLMILMLHLLQSRGPADRIKSNQIKWVTQQQVLSQHNVVSKLIEVSPVQSHDDDALSLWAPPQCLGFRCHLCSRMVLMP